MPVATRGRKRDLVKVVRVNPYIHYGFKSADLAKLPGISTADLESLGQKNLTSGLGLIVFSPQSPKPATFKKKLAGGVAQDSVTAYGNGSTATAVRTAAAAGWQLLKPVRPLSLGITAKSKEIVVSTTNNLYFAYQVPLVDATGENGALLGWISNVGPITLAKTVRSPSGVKIPLVTKESKTLPCSPAKIANALANGWRLTRQETGMATLL